MTTSTEAFTFLFCLLCVGSMLVLRDGYLSAKKKKRKAKSENVFLSSIFPSVNNKDTPTQARHNTHQIFTGRRRGAVLWAARCQTHFGPFAESGPASVKRLLFCPPAGQREWKSQQSNQRAVLLSDVRKFWVTSPLPHIWTLCDSSGSAVTILTALRQLKKKTSANMNNGSD